MKQAHNMVKAKAAKYTTSVKLQLPTDDDSKNLNNNVDIRDYPVQFEY